MTSKPPAQCCSVGVKHSGTPLGTRAEVDGKWDAYLAIPPVDKAHKATGILFCPDVIGIWENSCLLADQFAANGYLTMIIDLFNGDPVPLNSPSDFDLMKWLREGSDGKNPHTVETVDPIIEAAIRKLRDEYGIKKLGAVGYCYGAKYVVRFCNKGIDAGYLAHPSFVEEEELTAITMPLSIAAAETDTIFPAENRYRSEEILKAGGSPYQINLFSGVVHGFAVRGDSSKRVERFAKEQAFYQAVVWFNEYLT
ncbi:Alpha/Beta hydrolase protein [Ilyonectria destructans]|nr:Alpha/Beta hydrolase protein [Ilyonectria destructans]